MKKYSDIIPKFKKGDTIVRNYKFHSNHKCEYVNPYDIPFVSTHKINDIHISNFDTFVLKLYIFEDMLHAYDSKIVDIEFDLHLPTLRKNKLEKIKSKFK